MDKIISRDTIVKDVSMILRDILLPLKMIEDVLNDEDAKKSDAAKEVFKKMVGLRKLVWHYGIFTGLRYLFQIQYGWNSDEYSCSISDNTIKIRVPLDFPYSSQRIVIDINKIREDLT